MKLEGAYVDGDFVVNCQVICDCGRHIDAGYGRKDEMIFSGVSPDGRKHFGMVLEGSKTRTTRLSGRYEVGKDYAIQPKRTKKGIEGYRIVIDKKRKERCTLPGVSGGYFRSKSISKEDAEKEGGYTPEEFEVEFKKLFPKWDGLERWAYEFHLMWISMGEREDRIIVCERRKSRLR